MYSFFYSFNTKDIFQIPNAETSTNAAIVATTDIVSLTATLNRICGRRFNFNTITTINITLCSKLSTPIPFCFVDKGNWTRTGFHNLELM